MPEALIETDVDDVEKARPKGLLPKGGRKRALLRNTLGNARDSRERAASNSYHRDRVDMGRKKVPGSNWRSGPEQHAELTRSLGVNLKLGRRYSKIAGYLQSRGVRKSTDADTLDGFYDAVEKAKGLMPKGGTSRMYTRALVAELGGSKRSKRDARKLQGYLNDRMIGTRTIGGRKHYHSRNGGVYKSLDDLDTAIEKARGLMRVSGRRNQFRSNSGTLRAAHKLGAEHDKLSAKPLQWPKDKARGHRIGRLQRSLSYLGRRAKRNVGTKGLGYDER